MFSVHTTLLAELKTNQPPVILDIIVYEKCFSFTLKRKATVFKFLQFEERFRKSPFSCRFSVDGNPNRTNKVRSLQVWTLPKKTHTP